MNKVSGLVAGHGLGKPIPGSKESPLSLVFGAGLTNWLPEKKRCRITFLDLDGVPLRSAISLAKKFYGDTVVIKTRKNSFHLINLSVIPKKAWLRRMFFQERACKGFRFNSMKRGYSVLGIRSHGEGKEGREYELAYWNSVSSEYKQSLAHKRILDGLFGSLPSNSGNYVDYGFRPYAYVHSP